MAKIEINKVELVWPGKYNEDGTLKEVPRVSLPFQVIERVNESRATREAKKSGQQLSLFDIWEGDEGDTFKEGWRNKLIWGDNLLVMGSLLEKFAGKIDLIYIDPPFATGADFSVATEIGEGEDSIQKEQSIVEEKAYRDTWGRGHSSWLGMMYSRIVIMRDLLSENGMICVHIDYRTHSLVRLMLEEVFGSEHLVNEIVWGYRGGGVPKKAFARKHDNIVVYSNGDPKNIIFNAQFTEYSEASKQLVSSRGGVSIDGIQRDLERGAHMPDWWSDINSLQTWSPERVGFATQKPLALVERIIYSFTHRGSLVLDSFCGSGTTLVASEKLGRRWIGCDLSRYAIHLTRKRLLETEGCKPFEILNLGQYERQYWQGVTFQKKGEPEQQTLYEYLAFILRLYGAQPVSGMQHLHGKKGRALVHVGAVDTPVTIDEVQQALDECIALEQKELHVLGWEWEMGLNDLMVREAKKQGVKLLLLQIPREVMEQQAVDSSWPTWRSRFTSLRSSPSRWS